MLLFLAILALADFTTGKYGWFVLVWSLVIIGVPIGASRLLKKCKVSAKWNCVIIVLLAILCTVGMTAGVFISIDHDADFIFNRDEEVLLQLADFRAVDEDKLHSYPRKKDSIFLFCEEAYQREDWQEGEYVGEHLRLDYTFILVKLPMIYDFVKEELMKEPEYFEDIEEDLEDQSGYRKVDMPAWGAEEVYQYFDYDGEAENEFVVCYPDRMIQIDFSWKITNEDITKVKDTIWLEEHKYCISKISFSINYEKRTLYIHLSLY